MARFEGRHRDAVRYQYVAWFSRAAVCLGDGAYRLYFGYWPKLHRLNAQQPGSNGDVDRAFR